MKITLQKFQELYKLHLKGKSVLDISIEQNMPYNTVYYGFKRNNLEILKIKKNSKYKNSTNYSYFNKIDSERKAYFLGLIMADGCITAKNKNNLRLLMKLQTRDAYLVEELRNDLSPIKPLQIDGNSKRLEISSKELVQDLINKGVNFNKTKVGEILSELSKELMPHFIRGFFDGDGSISLRKTRSNQRQVYICCSNISFLESLQKYLLEYNISGSIYKETKIVNKVIYDLRFNTRESRLNLTNFMYQNATIFLKRKYELFISEHTNTELKFEINNSDSV